MMQRIRITEEDIERYMMTTLGGSPPLDILIRSSGVKRLSDFLMWQVRIRISYGCRVTSWAGFLQASENVQLHFIPTYWPDIGFWDLFPIILDYQAKVWSQQSKAGDLSTRSVSKLGVLLTFIVLIPTTKGALRWCWFAFLFFILFLRLWIGDFAYSNT